MREPRLAFFSGGERSDPARPLTVAPHRVKLAQRVRRTGSPIVPRWILLKAPGGPSFTPRHRVRVVLGPEWIENRPHLQKVRGVRRERNRPGL